MWEVGGMCIWHHAPFLSPSLMSPPPFPPSFCQEGKWFGGLTSSQVVFWLGYPWKKTQRKELGIGGLFGRWSLTAKGRKWGNLSREGGKAKEYMSVERVTSMDCWGFVYWEPSKETCTSELLSKTWEMEIYIISVNSCPSWRNSTLGLSCLRANQAPRALEESLRQRSRTMWALELGTVITVPVHTICLQQLWDNSEVIWEGMKWGIQSKHSCYPFKEHVIWSTFFEHLLCARSSLPKISIHIN